MNPYFQFARVEAGAVTTSDSPATLFTATIVLTRPEALLFDFRASVQCQYQVAGSDTLGAAFQFLLDDVPLPDPSFLQFDPATPPPNIDTFAGNATLRSFAPVVLPGTHTLKVQWQTVTPNSQATIFPGNANLTIEGK
jgi:hypothetical protein